MPGYMSFDEERKPSYNFGSTVLNNFDGNGAKIVAYYQLVYAT